MVPRPILTMLPAESLEPGVIHIKCSIDIGTGLGFGIGIEFENPFIPGTTLGPDSVLYLYRHRRLRTRLR